MAKLKGTILIVDDDTGILQTARVVLRQSFSEVHIEQNPAKLPFLLNNHSVDVVLLDMNFSAGDTSGKEGLQWLKKVKSIDPSCQVIMITAYGEINLAVNAMKYGANDFVVKPWENEKLLATTIAALNHRKTILEVEELKSKQKELVNLLGPAEDIVWGKSLLMSTIQKTVRKVGETDASVLILGENGTGKEVIANAIHQASARKDKPFIKVDLGAIPATLFESELFGHSKGAFTGAHQDRTGRFALASGGTLFLDEISNINPELQVKLLSVLQNRVIIPVGSSKEIPIDIRLIAATNSNIESLIEEGEFREDLLYRLKTVEITLPSLKERKEDIKDFVQHFLNIYSVKYRKQVTSVSPDAMEALMNYSWPGNIRELQHSIERAIILSDSAILKKRDFLLQAGDAKKTMPDSMKLDDVEKQAILDAINKFGGNLSKAARELGLGRTTLYRKIQKYGL